MIETLIVAFVVAILVGAILVYLIGPAINTIPAPIAQIVGGFCVKFGWVLGLLAGAIVFVSGWKFPQL